jgi:hypothetical protein
VQFEIAKVDSFLIVFFEALADDINNLWLHARFPGVAIEFSDILDHVDIIVAYKKSVASNHLVLNAAHWPDINFVGFFDVGLGEFPGNIRGSAPKALEGLCALFAETKVCDFADSVVQKNVW